MQKEESHDLDSQVVIPPAEYQEAEPIEDAIKVKQSSHNFNESSTGAFDLQDPELRIGQREEPNSLRNRLIWSVIMFLTGVGLIVAGFLSEAQSQTPGGGVPFWVIGSMLIIPGVYCAWDSIVTSRQQEKTDRQNILKEDGNVEAGHEAS